MVVFFVAGSLVSRTRFYLKQYVDGVAGSEWSDFVDAWIVAAPICYGWQRHGEDAYGPLRKGSDDEIRYIGATIAYNALFVVKPAWERPKGPEPEDFLTDESQRLLPSLQHPEVSGPFGAVVA